MQETWVWSLGWEDPLEEEMATHSRIDASVIPWTEEPGGLQLTGSQRVGHDWAQNTPATGLLEHMSLHSDPEHPGVPAGSVCLKLYFETQKPKGALKRGGASA